MRIDKLLTLYCFSQAKKILNKSTGLHIPILMYHSISNQLDDHLHPYFRTVTTPERFEQQVSFLSQSGYRVLTLSEAVDLLQQLAPSKKPSLEKSSSTQPKAKSDNREERMVVITFDDGFQDFYTTAFPILEKYGFNATVFLTSGLIGKPFITGRDCLKNEEIKELVRKGIEFGSHTVSHPQLKDLPKDKIADELTQSKQAIEDVIDLPVTLFSYPYRFPEEDSMFTKMFTTLLIEHGYTAGVTTIIGTAKTSDNPVILKRLPVNDCDDMQLFQAKLNGAYDWLHTAQLSLKKIRRIAISKRQALLKNMLNANV